ncbi:DUF3093 domain-containing protein [Ruania suaedae]|uniref:DUF3093 domain-containing protein n=1 Tax=Ruania suaedae TaxID=2897774 RepID=UPI001E2C939B|nr:DUF3093 domain-containing protein [Ruania suaedae]UFU01612.1 DUF3093 domain-containing protein [Ruania suaedae]
MAPSFTERVLPNAVGWLLAPAAGLLLGLALVPLDAVVALAAGLAATALTALVLVLVSPVVSVHDGVLEVDRARLPVSLVGQVTPLRGSELTRAMGPDLDARAHVRYRAWAGSAVRIVLDDPADPTPYWLVSTRRPAELARTLGHAPAE